jgi:ElaB/YqjD/DUF883 family membrane-anchored ribosome-binding protein
MSNLSEMADTAVEAKEELAANLRRVISDAEDLLAATAGDSDSRITELRARASRTWRWRARSWPTLTPPCARAPAAR